jgi:hypothetical protein
MILLALLLGCTDPDHTKDVLMRQGYTEIRTGGYAAFSCGEGDTYATRFSAKGPTGLPVTGAVCCGLVKNCTVRVD